MTLVEFTITLLFIIVFFTALSIIDKKERTKKTNNVISNSEYEKIFLRDPKIQEKALECALDVRKFEIELYWKRATYFWTFITVTFAGYFTVLGASRHSEKTLALISSIGFVFSCGWYFVNRGSKFWQSNWEKHVDMLEDKIQGPLYKVRLNEDGSSFIRLDSDYAFSVSKVNQYISMYIIIIWVLLLTRSLLIDSGLNFIFDKVEHFSTTILAVFTVCYVIFIGFQSKSGKGSKPKNFIRRSNNSGGNN